ncbi:unnamed protein product, partial [Polarella glacialis]
ESLSLEACRLLVPPVLEHLLPAFSEELLFTRVLPNISPYDYQQIGMVLRLASGHPRALRHMQVLQVLEEYRRSAAPSVVEDEEMSSLLGRLQHQFTSDSEAPGVRRHWNHLARRRLPWHAVALQQDPWPLLSLELQRQ